MIYPCIFNDRISKGGNAVTYIRLSVRSFPLVWTDWLLTLNFRMWVGYGHSWQGIEAHVKVMESG